MESGNDTIAAIATPPGEGGIAIVRISGPAAFAIADRIFRCAGPPPSGRAGGTFVFGRVVEDEAVVDEALCLVMRAPRSFTGDDTVELHGHGGNILARNILRAAIRSGARSAEPGEFSRRAFLNGKMDLLQAEAIADAIRAKTDRAAASAIDQLEGRLSRQFNQLYDEILAVAADVEASLDFPEDELPETVLPEIVGRLGGSLDKITSLLATWGEGHLLREGAMLVIAGRPNAGKSTLMNVLLGKDRAIVSHLPGTTRDIIEEGLAIEGLPVRLVDTAGLRDSSCEIEREGIRRSLDHLVRADLFLYVVDASEPRHDDDIRTIARLDPEKLVVVLNKMDLGRCARPTVTGSTSVVETSLTQGVGIDALRAAIHAKLETTSSSGDHQATISERHRHLLSQAEEHLRTATRLLETREERDLVLSAAALKESLEALGKVTGRAYEPELLDSIFSRFCIGK